jgi:hypothetical protein
MQKLYLLKMELKYYQGKIELKKQRSAAVFVFGGMFGFWGVFFAIPIATLIKAIWNSWPENLAN